MIDLHLHLDGSLSKEDFIYLSKKNGVSLGDDFPNNIVVNSDCTSLEEYLERFALPCSLLQDKESISYAVKSLVQRLYKLNYVYAEIRFAPLLHLEKGLNEEEVILAALDGLNEGLKGTKDFDANLILCCMRQVSDEINERTIRAAIEVNNPKIVAIDLAGPEAFKPTSEYKKLFEVALNAKLNVIIHAGEACGNKSILEAIQIGAKRIGHGVHLSLDEDMIKLVRENNIYFEFCPTSNLQTKSLLTYEDVPLRKFLDNQIKVTINSDNMTVSNTDVFKELKIMSVTFNLSKEEMLKLIYTSLDASFMKEEAKLKYIDIINRKIDHLFNK